jgi:sugar phosphate isomerase/epimerase
MHPHNIVFNPPTLQRLVEQTNATHVGAEMDPSHLFWQGMDPVACVQYLGDLVLHAAAKDIRINPDNTKVYGVLDDRFARTPTDANPLNLGGANTLNRWPKNPSWEFVAVGRGHSVEDFWVPFLQALHAVDPDIAVTSSTRTRRSTRSRVSAWPRKTCWPRQPRPASETPKPRSNRTVD